MVPAKKAAVHHTSFAPRVSSRTPGRRNHYRQSSHQQWAPKSVVNDPPKGNLEPQPGSEWSLAAKLATKVAAHTWGLYLGDTPPTVYYYDTPEKFREVYEWAYRDVAPCFGEPTTDAAVRERSATIAETKLGFEHKRQVFINESLTREQEISRQMAQPDADQEAIAADFAGQCPVEIERLKVLIHELLHAASSPPATWSLPLIESVTDQLAFAAMYNYDTSWMNPPPKGAYPIIHIGTLGNFVRAAGDDGVAALAEAYFLGDDSRLRGAFERSFFAPDPISGEYDANTAAYPMWVFMTDRNDIQGAVDMLTKPWFFSDFQRYFDEHCGQDGEALDASQEAARTFARCSGY